MAYFLFGGLCNAIETREIGKTSGTLGTRVNKWRLYIENQVYAINFREFLRTVLHEVINSTNLFGETAESIMNTRFYVCGIIYTRAR